MTSYDSIRIRQDAGIFGGRPTIGDHRVTVHDVVGVLKQGEQVDEIAADFELTRREVEAALAYYRDHESQIDCELAEDRRMTTELAAQDQSPAAERLRAAWNGRRGQHG